MVLSAWDSLVGAGGVQILWLVGHNLSWSIKNRTVAHDLLRDLRARFFLAPTKKAQACCVLCVARPLLVDLHCSDNYDSQALQIFSSLNHRCTGTHVHAHAYTRNTHPQTHMHTNVRATQTHARTRHTKFTHEISWAPCMLSVAVSSPPPKKKHSTTIIIITTTTTTTTCYNWFLNRPFAQLLSGLETGHPAAASSSSPYDFGAFDEQKAVFLVSVSDFSECDSSGLDHLNSSWSNVRVWEYFRGKNRPQLNSKKAEFLEWLVCIHRHLPQYTSRILLVSLWLFWVRSFGFGFGFFDTQVGASIVWKSTWKEKEDTVDCRSRKPSFLNAKYLSIFTSHTHCMYKPGALPQCNLKKQKPPGTNFTCVATSSPRFLPASDSEWPHHLSQRRRRGQTSRFLSMRLRASYSHLGDIGGRKENTDGTAPAFGKCLAFLGFKQLVMEESTSF